MDTIPLKLDGYTDLPPGKIANVVTYLEMTSAAGPPCRTADRRLRGPAGDRSRPGMVSRRSSGGSARTGCGSHIPLMPAAELAALLGDPAVEIHVLEQGGEVIGVAELDRRQPGDVEIVIFGVVPEAIGTGAAHHLMEGVLDAAFRDGHPAGMAAYLHQRPPGGDALLPARRLRAVQVSRSR